MNHKFLMSTLAMCMLNTTAYAAGLDRSGQLITPFLQDGNYFEAAMYVVDPDVSGKVRPHKAPPNTDLSTGEIAKDDQFYSAALKLQLTPNFSFGLLYDQPYSASAEYPTMQNGAFSSVKGNTAAEVDSQNLSLILGYQPNKNWNLYAGPVYQTLEGDVSIQGTSSIASGYKVSISEDHALGWMAGVAYQIPEIALKAAVTYRSEITHKGHANEEFSLPFSNLVPLVGEGESSVTTPESVNLDFQTGVSPRTLLFANLRWVNWSDFYVRPYQFGKITSLVTTNMFGYPDGVNLTDYSKDQYSANVGLGHKLTDKWSGVVYGGWDSGAGNPTSTLGPVEGYWAAGLGLQYNPTPKYFIAGGFKYVWLGDATAHSATHSIPGFEEASKVADFKDNTAVGYMMKIGYKF